MQGAATTPPGAYNKNPASKKEVAGKLSLAGNQANQHEIKGRNRRETKEGLSRLPQNQLLSETTISSDRGKKSETATVP